MSSFKSKPKLDPEQEFVNGSNVQPLKAEPAPVQEKAVPVRPEPKIQKNFRVRRTIAEHLMREAMEESINTGLRVTQESIVEAMLEERYKDK